MPLLLALVLAPQPGVTRRAELPCLPGRFLVESVAPPEVIALDADGTLTLERCETEDVRVRARRGTTYLRAELVCRRQRKLRLAAEIEAPECTLRGRIHGPRSSLNRIVAPRSSCGDGVLDLAGGEQCDTSQPGGDVACPGSCGEPSSQAACLCTEIETAPQELAAEIAGADVRMHWTPPDPASGLSEVRILRRLNEPPSDANDPLATLVFAGSADEASDAMSALLPDTASAPHIYHYAAFGCVPGGVCETTGSRTVVAPTLTQALAAGGYVIHWRHASADVCNDFTFYGPASTTKHPDWWKSCERDCTIATARQLSEAGMHEATVIGEELRARSIPFGRVVTSEYCRNFQTADLMALGPLPEQSQVLSFFVYENERCRDSYALIGELPAARTNTALIGHTGFGSNVCPVLETLAWGEAAVFKPDGLGGAEYVTRLLWDQWSTLP